MTGDKPREPVVAGGCLVTRGEGAGTEVLLVHRPRYDDWSLPKGKRHAGEHLLETAVREVFEETGLRVALRRPLPSREYLVDGVPKVVHYWHAQVLAAEGFVATDEVDDVRWLPVADAVDLATHPLDGALVAHAFQPPATPFLVLRHAKAVKRSAWDGVDTDRPLDPTGRKQAHALVPLLAAYGTRAVHSSAARRCLDTVVPYAEGLGAAVTSEESLTEEAFHEQPQPGLDRAAGLLADASRRGTPTVLCGHRPVMPALIAHLLEGSEVVGPTDTLPTGSFVVLHTVGGVAVAAEHHLLD